MKKFFKFGLVCTLSLLGVMGCGGTSSGGGGGVSPSTATPSFSQTNLSVMKGSSNDLELSLIGGNVQGAVFTLSSSNPAVAILSVPNCQLSSGIGSPHSCQVSVYGLTDGTATITATSSGFNSVSAQVNVQASPVLGALSFSKTSEKIIAGGNNHVTISLKNSSGETVPVQITSSNSSVATTTPTTCNLYSGANNSCDISLNGQSGGSATITASSGSGYSTSMSVNVSGNVQYGTLSFDRTSINLSPNTTTQETLSLNDSTGVESAYVSLSSSNPSVAVVSPNACILSSQVSLRSCVVDVKGIASGTANITATSVYNGHIYNITPIAVNVSNSGLTMSTQVKNVSQTVYNAQTYNAEFTFTNNTATSVNLGQMVITNSGYPLNIQLDPSPCSNITLQAGGTCIITGNNMNIQNPNQITQLNFLLPVSGSGGVYYTYSISMASVLNYPGYAAFRIINHQNPGYQGWLVALGKNSSGQAVVQFNESGLGSLLPQSDSYAMGQIQIPSTPLGLVVYQPNYAGGESNTGIGGLMYVSLESPVYEPAGNVGVPPIGSDYNQYINYSVYEPNVYNGANDQLLANLDVTAINAVGVTQGFYATDITTGINKNPGFLYESYSQFLTESLYTQMQNTLVASWPNTWGVSGQFVYSPTNPSTWVGLRGLVDWVGQNPSTYPTGFNSDLYTQYVNDLWAYYAESGHQMLIDAGEIHPGCMLKAFTVNSESMQVEPTESNNCPVTSATGPNIWFWSKFQPVDFVGGAPDASNSTLGGADGTYRSMGKYVSAGQSVGFLPYCSDPNFVYGPTNFNNPSVQANYWTVQYSCLANYNQYTNDVINQYDWLFHQYIPLIYAWSYDDALGISSEVDIDPTKSVFTLVIHKFYNTP